MAVVEGNNEDDEGEAILPVLYVSEPAVMKLWLKKARSLAPESQPVKHQQGGWVGCVFTVCLCLIERRILCIFWEKCQAASVDVRTIFKNPDIYWARMFFSGPPV